MDAFHLLRAALLQAQPALAAFLEQHQEVEKRVHRRFARPDGSIDYKRLDLFVNRVNYGQLPPEELQSKSLLRQGSPVKRATTAE